MQREKMIAREMGCLGADFNDLQAHVLGHLTHIEEAIADNKRRREAASDTAVEEATARLGLVTRPYDYPTLRRELSYIQDRVHSLFVFVSDQIREPEGSK